MGDFKTFSSFKKAFIKAIPNFDETKIHFEQKGKLINGMFINFVHDGKLKKCKVYCDSYYIELWKQHFIEFLETGIFDFNGYWELYEKKDIDPSDLNRVYKFPLCTEYKNDCYKHCDELDEFLGQYRQNYPNCGIKLVPKPIDKK